MSEQLEEFRRDHDYLRHALVNEPRGSEVIVGGLLCEPTSPDSAAGIIFFNNVGYLGMCVHGTIGLMVTLEASRQDRRGRTQDRHASGNRHGDTA